MGTRYALMYLALTIERDPLNTLSRVKAITAGHKKRKSTTAIPATTKRQLLVFYYITVFAHLPLSFVSAQPTLQEFLCHLTLLLCRQVKQQQRQQPLNGLNKTFIDFIVRFCSRKMSVVENFRTGNTCNVPEIKLVRVLSNERKR